MKSALLLILALGATSARADWCTFCDSIRNPFGSQTIPLVYPEEDEDDSATEAGLPAALRVRKNPSLRIELAQHRDPLSGPVVPRPTPAPQVFTVAVQAGQMINSIRAQRGLHPLQSDENLNREALRFAQEMYQRDELSHQGQDGDVGQRLHRARVGWGAVGENIARGQRGAAEVVNDWLSSPGHAGNILGSTPVSAQFRRHGIAEYGGFWVHIFTD